MHAIIVVNKTKDWCFDVKGIDVVSVKTYLTDPRYVAMKNVRVFNFCRSFRYQSMGYYVSLIAEARGHKPIPSVTTIQDLKSQVLGRVVSDEIDDTIQRSLRKIKSDHFTLSVYFGKNVAKQYDALSKQLYNLFPAPMLRAQFFYSKRWNWQLQSIGPISIKDIPESHSPDAERFAGEYFAKKRFHKGRKHEYFYSLAILVNPEEVTAPSDKAALQRFSEAADKLGISTDFITRDDFNRIPEYDALFIRETTNVNHHTYRFARRAEAEGLVVIDNPDSILRCSNKIYLTELLSKARIATPKSLIVHKDNKEDVLKEVGLPCILKLPDAAFSKGVVKVEDEEGLRSEINKFLEHSDLILAQEFIPTPFDWRIGVLDKKPLFACKYFMAKNHWQIYNWSETSAEGDFETLPIHRVPEKVIKTALASANLIGDGLYGVDLKEVDQKVVVIEINDNPSVDAGIEDQVLGNELYMAVIQSLLDRIKRKKGNV